MEELIVTKKQGSGGESDVPMKNRKLIKKATHYHGS